MENINEYFDNRRNVDIGDGVVGNVNLSTMTVEEKFAYIRKFIAIKNKNKKRPTQEEVTAEINSLKGHYYTDINGNFRFKDGTDE